MSKKPFFDAVLLIDCWDNQWLNKEGAFNNRESYGRIADFLSLVDVRLGLYSCGGLNQDIHPIFYDVFPEMHRVESILPFEKHVKTRSKILLAGQTFGQCFHYNKLGCLNLIKKGYKVFTSPKLIITDHETSYVSRKKIIKKDSVVNWSKLPSGIYKANSINNLSKDERN